MAQVPASMGTYFHMLPLMRLEYDLKSDTMFWKILFQTWALLFVDCARCQFKVCHGSPVIVDGLEMMGQALLYHDLGVPKGL